MTLRQNQEDTSMPTTSPAIEQKSDMVAPVEIAEPPAEMALRLPSQGGFTPIPKPIAAKF